MCVAKCFIVSRNVSLFCYIIISENVSFCLFCEKQGSDANETFRKQPRILFVLLLSKVEITNCINRSFFSLTTVSRNVPYITVSRNYSWNVSRKGCETSEKCHEIVARFACFAKQQYTVSSKTLALHLALSGFPRNRVSSFLFSDEIVSAKFAEILWRNETKRNVTNYWPW
jgi:hypothetical protein